MTSTPKRSRLMALLGFTGPSPAGRKETAITLTTAVVCMIVVAIVLKLLAVTGWLSVLLGSCAAVAVLRLNPGSRLTRRRHRDLD
ncbi:hypothetical protein AB0C51_16840 [Streptomyces pathocidini]|uniref:hypothetical protein n=1 Tax=Streptomyces pathocidini TaxID=1650571 RepID=UPI0033E113FC